MTKDADGGYTVIPLNTGKLSEGLDTGRQGRGEGRDTAIVHRQITEPNYPCTTEWKQAQPGRDARPSKATVLSELPEPSLSLPSKAALSPPSSVQPTGVQFLKHQGAVMQEPDSGTSRNRLNTVFFIWMSCMEMANFLIVCYAERVKDSPEKQQIPTHQYIQAKTLGATVERTEQRAFKFPSSTWLYMYQPYFETKT